MNPILSPKSSTTACAGSLREWLSPSFQDCSASHQMQSAPAGSTPQTKKLSTYWACTTLSELAGPAHAWSSIRSSIFSPAWSTECSNSFWQKKKLRKPSTAEVRAQPSFLHAAQGPCDCGWSRHKAGDTLKCLMIQSPEPTAHGTA